MKLKIGKIKEIRGKRRNEKSFSVKLRNRKDLQNWKFKKCRWKKLKINEELTLFKKGKIKKNPFILFVHK